MMVTEMMESTNHICDIYIAKIAKYPVSSNKSSCFLIKYQSEGLICVKKA